MKETHNSTDHLLPGVNYQDWSRAPRWIHKVSLFSVSLRQSGRQEWPLRQGLKCGSCNVQCYPLVDANKIQHSPLHIKLGVMKNIVKTIDREDIGLLSSRISMEKFKAGIYLTALKLENLWKAQCLTKHWAKLNCPPGSHWSQQLQTSWETPGVQNTRRKLKNYWWVSANSGNECQSNCTFCSHTWTISQELWRFEWRAEWALSPSNGRALTKPVERKFSRWLRLVLETGCGSWQAQEEIPEKPFHPWICSFVHFSIYYGTVGAFGKYICPKFSIICFNKKINRVIILLDTFQVRVRILKIWSD